jgi:polysaccharide biosynthesis/export protein
VIRKCLQLNFRALLGLAVLFAFTFTSCSSAKTRGFFTDLPNQDVIHLPPMPYEERVIEAGDYLVVRFTARDNEAASFFDKMPTGGGANGETGYQVDPIGNIEFPILGKVKVTGLTANQLKENLTRSVSVYLKEPLVDVRFTTFRISVIGVGAGIKVLPMQRNTLLEGLALAGDIEQTGKLYDVRLFREYKGQRSIYQVDLSSKAVLNNPEIFQLRHNDVIYVKTRPSALFREDLRFYTSIFSFAVGVITLGFTIANRN